MNRLMIVSLAMTMVGAAAAQGDWLIEIVDDEGDVGSWCSLALDATGHPHISYLDRANENLMYTRGDGSAWRIETVENSDIAGEHTAGRHELSWDCAAQSPGVYLLRLETAASTLTRRVAITR